MHKTLNATFSLLSRFSRQTCAAELVEFVCRWRCSALLRRSARRAPEGKPDELAAAEYLMGVEDLWPRLRWEVVMCPGWAGAREGGVSEDPGSATRLPGELFTASRSRR